MLSGGFPLTGKRASVLAAKGTVDIILRVIVNASKEASVCEEILLLSYIILTKVGPKGRNMRGNIVNFMFKIAKSQSL